MPVRLGLLCLALALLGAGCGLAASEDGPSGATVTVTRNFGGEPLGEVSAGSVAEGDTVMGLLERRFEVRTGERGRVRSIDGVAEGRRAGRLVDWVYFVNGIQARLAPPAKRVFPGDRVWWDHHVASADADVRAVVGSFPEPFLSGQEGKRFPVRLDCARDSRRACDEVAERLEIAGITTLARSTIGQRQEGKTLRVVVGRWRDVRLDLAARQIERGPQVSGVFARFSADGRRLAVLDVRGRLVRSIGSGGALVAATVGGAEPPTWVVTGTDDVGVAAAAAALRTELLADRFAVAIEAGRAVPLPLDAALP
jgi:hypothetical protein